MPIVPIAHLTFDFFLGSRIEGFQFRIENRAIGNSLDPDIPARSSVGEHINFHSPRLDVLDFDLG